MPAWLIAGKAITELVSAGKYIQPNTVVLPVNFARGGKDIYGQVVTDRNWIFTHQTAYLGLEKPLIIIDNYEANTGYFPIGWQKDVNPYIHLGNGKDIEGMAENAEINNYKNSTGVNIDYILMWCYDSVYLHDEHFAKVYSDIQASYHILYISPTRRVILYGLNN